MNKVCEQCDSEFLTKDRRNRFCSRSCASTFNNLNGLIGAKKCGVDYGTCPGCGKEFKRSQKYCSFSCAADHKTRRWLAGEIFETSEWCTVPDFIKAYMLDECWHQCSWCGWSEVNPFTGSIPLEIDHIDGDCMNNAYKNLRVLCPSCHSLTETYRTLNRGNKGRKRSQNQPIRDSK